MTKDLQTFFFIEIFLTINLHYIMYMYKYNNIEIVCNLVTVCIPLIELFCLFFLDFLDYQIFEMCAPVTILSIYK